MMHIKNVVRRQLVSVAVAMVWLVALSGCSEERKISEKAQWLCEYGQFEEFDPEAFPRDRQLEEYVDARELDYFKREQLRDDGDDDEQRPGAGPRRMLADVRASYTDCTIRDIAVDEDDGVATVELRRLVPDVEWTLDEIEEASRQEMVERFEDVSEDTPVRDDWQVIFVRDDDGWGTEFGFKSDYLRRELEEVADEIGDIEDEQLPRARQAADDEQNLEALSQFRVDSASLDITDETERWGDLEVDVQVGVTNHSDERLGRVDFEITYRVPGQQKRSGEFYFDGRDLRAGETRRVELEALDDTPFGDDVPLDDNAAIDVSVVRLYNHLNTVIAEAGDPDVDQARRAISGVEHDPEWLEEQLDELEERKQQIEDTLSAWDELLEVEE